MKTLRNTLIASIMVASSASALAAAPEEASIPFVNLNQSIHSWQADGQQGLWIQDVRKDWYYAKLQGPCIGLEFAPRLGFEPRTTNSLDKFGTVIVPNQGRCQIMSLTRSSEPADEKKMRKKTEAK